MPKLNAVEKRLVKRLARNAVVFTAAYITIIKLAENHYSN